MKPPLMLRLVSAIWRYVMTIYLLIGAIVILTWSVLQGHAIPVNTSSAGKLLLAGVGLSLVLTVLGNAAVAIAIEGMVRAFAADRIALAQDSIHEVPGPEQEDSA